MRFLLLLYGDHEAEQALPKEDSAAIVEQHIAFGGQLRADGAHVLGEALDGPGSAKVVRSDGTVIDGPFTQAQEQLGGIYVIECADVDTALGYAKQVPRSPGLSVEVRPILAV